MNPFVLASWIITIGCTVPYLAYVIWIGYLSLTCGEEET